jgi:hypothetical protein
MIRLLSVLSVLLALGFVAAPEAKAQSSGAPTGCPNVGCNPYFNAYFPPASWPVMSWLDNYSPNLSPPGGGCVPGTAVGCARGQGVATSRFNPAYDVQQYVGTVGGWQTIHFAGVNGSQPFMSGAFVDGQAMRGAPGNQIFPASDYALDCNPDPAFLMATWGNAAAYACKMTKAPIMDMSEIQTKLENQGYVWYLSYPYKDTGTGHAVVTYAKYGASCPSVSIPPPIWWTIPQQIATRTYTNLVTGQGGAWPCMQGYARVTNAGWVDQFQTSPPICTRYDWSNGVYGCIYSSFPHGDYLGQYFSTLPVNSQANALRLVASFGTSTDPTYATLGSPAGTPAAGAFLVPIIDPWVSTPSAPPVANAPPPAPPAPPVAVPVNVGDVTIGAGGGTLTPGGIDTSGGVPFDWIAYCNMATSSDGTPRSQLWIQTCLSGH